MKSRVAVNLLLILVVSLLGLLLWWSQPDTLPPLTQLDPQQVRRIDINDLEGRKVALSRSQGQWMIDNQLADQSRVRQMLKICSTPSLRRFRAPDDLRPYGLAPAPLLLRLDSATLMFGDTDPLNGWRYVHYMGEIHLIADGFYHHLTASPQAWLAADPRRP
ncbi:MAG: hypothetical protein AB2598_13050 [Candidatus Thiodiazotropha sp.]